MTPDMNPRAMRRTFAKGVMFGLRVVWPVLSGLMLAIAAMGMTVGRLEGWSIGDSIYFAFVSGLTIGYGDFSPKTLLGRTLAIVIGICGVLMTALIAAIAVKAMSLMDTAPDSSHED